MPGQQKNALKMRNVRGEQIVKQRPAGHLDQDFRGSSGDFPESSCHPPAKYQQVHSRCPAGAESANAAYPSSLPLTSLSGVERRRIRSQLTRIDDLETVNQRRGQMASAAGCVDFES